MSTEQASNVHDGDFESAAADTGVLYEEQVQPEYGILGFTLRELLMLGAWLILFVVSFFGVVPGGRSLWTSGISWILTAGVPTVAVFLVVLRRFSPDGIRRVGSLGIDQFASVASAVAVVAWAQLLWAQIAVSIETGIFLVGWVVIVSEIAAIGLVTVTVIAPLIPRLCEDFRGRMETLAHRNANPVRPVVPRPKPVAASPEPSSESSPEPVSDTSREPSPSPSPLPSPESGNPAPILSEPVAPEPVAPEPIAPGEFTDASEGTDPEPQAVEYEPAENEPAEPQQASEPGVITALTMVIDDSVPEQHSAGPHADASDRDRAVGSATGWSAPAQEPFWILAATERDVLDEHGHPLFPIGPSAWALVIEDRGGAYVVRHDDGRIGYLHDITDITKG